MSAFPGPRDWGRLLTAMLTPFREDGSVNLDEVGRIATHLVDEQAADGLVVCGTTGEAPTLTPEEKAAVLEATLSAVGRKAAVVMGAGTYDTAESIRLTQMAERAGAHGVMLVNPYYNRPGQDGLFAHFSTVARHTELPVVLYNIAPRSCINLETETLLRLCEIRNIVAVKEASGNMAQVDEVCRRAPSEFRVYSGDDSATLPMLALGAHGLISVASHVCGNDLSEMISSFESDPGRARELHRKVAPMTKVLFASPSPVPVKYATSISGFDCERVRLPLVGLSDLEKQQLREALVLYVSGCVK